MKVITFSRYFPTNHPKKGVNTFFPEQILLSLGIGINDVQAFKPYMNDFAMLDDKKKVHTIRAGNRWKEREYFSPRIWTGKPYQSKQLQFAPPIQIKKIWNFETFQAEDSKIIYFKIDDVIISAFEAEKLCTNDGLEYEDFLDWFNVKPGKPFVGQIIGWDEKVKYSSENPDH